MWVEKDITRFCRRMQHHDVIRLCPSVLRHLDTASTTHTHRRRDPECCLDETCRGVFFFFFFLPVLFVTVGWRHKLHSRGDIRPRTAHRPSTTSFFLFLCIVGQMLRHVCAVQKKCQARRAVIAAKLAELEAQESALEAQLKELEALRANSACKRDAWGAATPDLFFHNAAFHDEKISILNLGAALRKEKAALQELEPKVVQYLNEDGDFVAREFTRHSFNTWLAEVSSLVVVTPDLDATTMCIASFDSLDQHPLYRLERHPLDVKVCMGHLGNLRRPEFGKACESLVRVEYPGFVVVTEGSRGGKLNSTVEVDFYATKGEDAIVGMFHPTLPPPPKLARFFLHCQELRPRPTTFLLGVLLANSAALRTYQSQFHTVLVGSGTGFLRL